MIEIELRLFGALRRWETRGEKLMIQLSEPTPVHGVKQALAAKLANFPGGAIDAALIADSAVADDTRILGPDEFVERKCVLSILPPVCGG